MKLIVEADGGSRGNPGFSGAGAVVVDQHGVVLKEISVPLGIATNNFAEYTAVILGLEAAFEIDPSAEILVKMDSKLVVEQMSGRWKIKHPDMISLGARVQALVSGKKVEFTWIPRELNFRADALANAAMDGADLPSAAVMEFNSSLPSSIRAPKISETVCTTLILVRHGRTAHTESRKVSGGDGDNPDLSELGQRDAREVAAEVAKIGKSGSSSSSETNPCGSFANTSSSPNRSRNCKCSWMRFGTSPRIRRNWVWRMGWSYQRGANFRIRRPIQQVAGFLRCSSSGW